jgi:hypothetical protein
MYRVIHQSKAIEFGCFLDAWLYAFLELRSWSKIVGSDGTWIVNPALTN